MHANRLVNCLLLSFLLVPLSGCIGGKTPPSSFYLLEPVGESASGASGAASRTLVALAPVRVPRYVDRPQIVTATAKNAYYVSELNRWAESLDDNISRVLVQNLSILAPVDAVQVSSSNRARQAQWRVAITILEFHVDPKGQAGLTAQWLIAGGDEVKVSRQVAYRAPASTTDYPVMVAALNDCLSRMSRELASSLQQAIAEGK